MNEIEGRIARQYALSMAQDAEIKSTTGIHVATEAVIRRAEIYLAFLEGRQGQQIPSRIHEQDISGVAHLNQMWRD